MEIKAVEASDSLKEKLMEMIAEQQQQEAMDKAVTSMTNAIYIVALANTENPAELVNLALEKINTNTERFSQDEENEQLSRDLLVDIANAIKKIVTNPVAKTGNGQALSEALKADNAERMAEE